MAAGDGLVSMAPSSITYSGTSASINASGGVDFTSLTELNMNGVFTSGFDNYAIFVHGTTASGNNEVAIRLRASGTDATGTDYEYQRLFGYDSNLVASRSTSESKWNVIPMRDTVVCGGFVVIYGPFIAQATCMTSLATGSFSDAELWQRAATHSLSTSYDGFTAYPTGSTMSGNIHVFGYEE